jgi:hypothetical protein
MIHPLLRKRTISFPTAIIAGLMCFIAAVPVAVFTGIVLESVIASPVHGCV